MVATTTTLDIRWEKLPDDFVLPDDPVDNIAQPALAASLTEALGDNGRLHPNALTTTNYGICATVNGKVVVKAPDWAYIPRISVSQGEVHRSYTPQLQGDFPLIVMEFLSDEDGHEYSIKPTYPPGKWFFYEQVLQVPYYVLFNLESSALEFYKLGENKRYDIVAPNEAGRYWIPEMDLALGPWSGTRGTREGVWLRWWSADDRLLLWGHEQAIAERQRAEKLAEKLRSLGVNPDEM
ncbi:Uma2 family endonuclease [Oscillatoria sp. CS-180]|uniref:Uma2 family endonuclease n=1 Tax=Oscillatoria sp. CS-180 TaxID=3021720 RepID=UPI002330C009|nr:Uma2 family endonuclease [Oscillatoria sp. CS-180]MDB9529486.1 Uma2 family endonuclease [Oscillatoria sp. CS-180]